MRRAIQFALASFVLVPTSSFAQTYQQTWVFEGNTDGAYCVYAADLDGDGDLDILSANTTGTPGWYENLGSGLFGPKQEITSFQSEYTCVVAADMDGDGDLDVLLASRTFGIMWYENLGNGTFGTQRIITTNADGVYSVDAVDLDNDGDLDVISASYYFWVGTPTDNKVAVYENTGGGNFAGQLILNGPDESPTSAVGAREVCAADLNGDGYKEVIAVSHDDDKVTYYENQGGMNFGPQQIISTTQDGPGGVRTADINNDGYADVIVASSLDDTVAWYENLGGGAFGPKQVLPGGGDGVNRVRIIDMNRDGYLDVLSASRYDDTIAWNENLGNGVFGPQQVITNNADFVMSIHAADVTGNGCIDILSACHFVGEIALYERVDCPVPSNYCTPPSPNSASPTGAHLRSNGSTSLSANELSLTVEGLVPDQFGIFFFGPLKEEPGIPFGNGLRCVSSFGMSRLNPAIHTGTGEVQQELDMTSVPLSDISAGDIAHFQFWYRDPGTGANFNLSDALSIPFVP